MGLLGEVASLVAKRGDDILGLLKAGRAADVTDDMLDLGDPVLNARLNEHLYRNYDLPMDSASRMGRADGMGYVEPGYHGTYAGEDFATFGRPRSFMRMESYFAPENKPDFASSFADNEGGRVLPVMLRSGDFIDGRTTPGNERLMEILQDNNLDTDFRLNRTDGETKRLPTWGEQNVIDVTNLAGETGIRLQERPGMTSAAVFDPTAIRSRFARFDPRLSHLKNVSAGVGGTALGFGLLGDGEAQAGEMAFDPATGAPVAVLPPRAGDRPTGAQPDYQFGDLTSATARRAYDDTVAMAGMGGAATRSMLPDGVNAYVPDWLAQGGDYGLAGLTGLLGAAETGAGALGEGVEAVQRGLGMDGRYAPGGSARALQSDLMGMLEGSGYAPEGRMVAGMANAVKPLARAGVMDAASALVDSSSGSNTFNALADFLATEYGGMRLYHGTSSEGAAGIREAGRINGPAFFTPDRSAAATYADGGEVLEFDVPTGDLMVDLDLPGARLLSASDAAAYLGRDDLENIEDFIRKGFSVGLEGGFAFGRNIDTRTGLPVAQPAGGLLSPKGGG
jgi:hypothetical protein